MPILIAVIGALSAALFWYYRMKAAKEAATELLDVANDVRLAARRFGYKRRTKTHPTDTVDDARLAAAGIVAAIASMSGYLEKSQIEEMTRQFKATFDTSPKDAVEITTFGRWISTQCQSNSEAVRRLSKRLYELAGPEALPDLERIIEATLDADPNSKGPDEEDAMRMVRRHLAKKG